MADFPPAEVPLLMYPAQATFPDDYLTSSNIFLASLVLLAVLAGVSYQAGLLGWLIRVLYRFLQGTVSQGFLLWKRLLSWASWPLYAAMVLGLLVLGVANAPELPGVAILCSLALLFCGVTACLAYVYIDVESYEVSRGYKTLANPAKGQELAVNLARYGPRVGVPLLVAATVAAIGGFALLNQGLYDTVGPDWYDLRAGKAGPASPPPGDDGGETVRVRKAGQTAPGYTDFLAYTLLHLLRIVDLLNIAENYNLRMSYIHPRRWPASTLLTLFKTFFTMVLLQQIFASFRQMRLLAQTIQDFWSPHVSIHEQACVSLPQHGPRAVRPLFASLRAAEFLTVEQRAQVPEIVANIGSAVTPVLGKYLRDPNENVRAVAVAALGRLTALEALPRLVRLSRDESAWVRQSLAETLGLLGSASPEAGRRRRWFRRRRRAAGPGWLARWTGWARRKLPPQELAVATLRSLLADPATQVRVQAAAGLGKIGTAAQVATPELIAMLRDADESVRCQAAEALGQLGGSAEETVNALAELLQDPSAAVQAAAAKALGALKHEAAEAVPSLVPLLQDPDEGVRKTAAQAIGEIGTVTEEAAPDLVAGLASQDNVIRAQTAEALGTIGEPAAGEAIPALIRSLADPNDRVRAKSAEALGKLGPAAAEAVPRLIEALRDEDTAVRARAAAALGEMGGAAEPAVPGLVECLRHVNPQVRANAAHALGRIDGGARPALAALEEAARDAEGEVRSQALFALGEIGDLAGAAAQVLLAGLDDPDPQVRAAAVEALGKRDEVGDSGVQALLRALGDASDDVKVAVTRALPQRAGAVAAVVEGLCRLLQEGSPTVQAGAAQALGKLGVEARSAGPFLLHAVQTGEAAVREQAIRAVVLIQPPEAALAFAVGLRDAQEEVRKLASAGLMKVSDMPPEVVPELVEALRDPHIQVRSNAAHALARLDPVPEQAIPLLVEYTADPDDGLRLSAVLALKAASPEKVKAVVHHLIDDPNLRIRLLAASLLLVEDPADPRAGAILVEALSEPAAGQRKRALEVVSALGPRAAAFLNEVRQRVEVEIEPEVRDLLLQTVAGFDLAAGDGAAAPTLAPDQVPVARTPSAEPSGPGAADELAGPAAGAAG
jgi:HEAT repeat protein